MEKVGDVLKRMKQRKHFKYDFFGVSSSKRRWKVLHVHDIYTLITGIVSFRAL